ncbi:prolyl oligopeptidase family serine peptidase [Lacrimispora indolis]|uniref:prolyl oligopeptidase family serine peptidase n=1 Tax=Lacrimispora indolis TaxID=69825 RepID=UPI0004A39853|nr:prolyl oligopeptidase family serine peptidase [[Clostridium] methoxybenzovorans]
MIKNVWGLGLVLLILSSCGSAYAENTAVEVETEMRTAVIAQESKAQTGDYVTEGTGSYHDFVVDSVLHSDAAGDIHYCVFIPDEYDGSEAYSLYITLPGYQGLYFQGAAMNIRTEEFAFEAQKYQDNMMILAPQLEDWGETSARKTIALTEYFLNTYNIDREQVYISGYSGGGETLSLMLDSRPELYTAALMCSSRWDSGYEAVVKARTPVYFVTGESDEYYGAEPFHRAYQEIRRLYEEEGLSEIETDTLAVLDVRPAAYFADRGVTNQHGGGGRLFSRDSEIMGWLFGEHDKFTNKMKE